jgi:hypothetical protein
MSKSNCDADRNRTGQRTSLGGVWPKPLFDRPCPRVAIILCPGPATVSKCTNPGQDPARGSHIASGPRSAAAKPAPLASNAATATGIRPPRPSRSPTTSTNATTPGKPRRPHPMKPRSQTRQTPEERSSFPLVSHPPTRNNPQLAPLRVVIPCSSIGRASGC